MPEPDRMTWFVGYEIATDIGEPKWPGLKAAYTNEPFAELWKRHCGIGPRVTE